MDQSNHLTSWDLFVLRHRDPANLVVHFISWITYVVSFIFLLITWNWWWILGLCLSGVIGVLGHHFFQDGTIKVSEATYDPKTPFFVTFMFFKIFSGRYWNEVKVAEEKFKVYEQSRS